MSVSFLGNQYSDIHLDQQKLGNLRPSAVYSVRRAAISLGARIRSSSPLSGIPTKVQIMKIIFRRYVAARTGRTDEQLRTTFLMFKIFPIYSVQKKMKIMSRLPGWSPRTATGAQVFFCPFIFLAYPYLFNVKITWLVLQQRRHRNSGLRPGSDGRSNHLYLPTAAFQKMC